MSGTGSSKSSGMRGYQSPSTSTSSSSSTVSSGRGGSEGSWWRWTQGRSGSISSSSEGVASASTRSASKSSPEAWDSGAVRWEKRPARTKEAAASTVSPKARSPLFFSSASQLRASSRSTLASRRKAGHFSRGAVGASKLGEAAASEFRGVSRPSSNGVHEGKSKPVLQTVTQDERPFLADTAVKWTTGTTGGTTKRNHGRNNKRTTRTPSPRTRTATPDMRGSHAVQHKKSAFVSVDDVVMMDAAESVPAFSSPPTRPTATAVSSLGFGNPDPLVKCARAVLQDCLRQRCLDSNNVRKRTLEGCSKCDAGKDTTFSGFTSRTSEFGSFSGCSSSSDDELSQLSSMEFALAGADKTDCKTSSEELYRQLMLCDYSLSTSPDFECFSPLFEEKGLPVEIRYQLPLALGTANETDKECTICQLRYGIGDHIVTLPCQHFFHACCVDKWLWNHTSCPLCRTEVSLEPNVNQAAPKHRFSECPKLDQETMRRKMRSSSHSVGFRPVIPAKLEVDLLDSHLTNLSIDEDETESSSLTYLVCPKPQRSHPKPPH